MSKLVIVESPTKVKSISKYLPKDCKVASCVGHIRDLPSSKAQIPKSIKDKPWADYGIDYENDFQAHYVTIKGKAKVIAELKSKLKGCDELYLATDEDREGESISWHLVEALKPKVPVKRMVFNEITKEAIQEALANPREMDMHLVQAQETRRILDRLYGYTLSPLLWKKIGGSLSAGRVQSVAVRLVVIRERERRAFRSGSYWDLKALLSKDASDFEARLVSLDGMRIATSKDFDKDTGKIEAGKDVLLLEEPRARELQERLKVRPWKVTDVQDKSRESSPAPPFITSTLQQESNNRLNMSASQTMRTAQRLYENGFITYMRTDSTTLSEEAVKAARGIIKDQFGPQYLPGTARTYAHKKSKSAQEAHEAIRPAGSKFIDPGASGLTGKERDLYTLIWQRTVASQMANERYTSTSVTIQVDEAEFSATGKTVDFPGWRAVYPTLMERDTQLPPLAVGDAPKCKSLDAEGHETKPPARYTEATLVRALEEAGIGRPSTYADILDKITSKNYVVHKGKALVPTFTAFAVTGLLEKHFEKLVDLRFSAGMEETLDEIAAGEAEWLPYLEKFFLGDDGLKKRVEDKLASMDAAEARVIELEGLPFTVKIGRFGPYVEGEFEGEKVNASIPETTTPDELTTEMVQALLKAKHDGPSSITVDPDTGKKVFVMTGRFGPYVQLGTADEADGKPPRTSLPRGITPETLTPEDALFLAKLPKELGAHPGGGRVVAGLGRYGPFVAHEPAPGEKMDYRNLAGWDALKNVTFDDAMDLLKQPKAGRRGGGASRAPLKELGAHPKDGKPVQLFEGRYGPYVKHDKTNATVPKAIDPMNLTLDEAVKLIADKKAK